MRRQGLRQPERVAVGGEPGIDLRWLDPAAPLGHPQRRMIGAAEPGPDVLRVVGHRLDRPAHHRRDVAAPRRLPAHRLAITDMQHPVPAELRGRRVAAPVGHIQPGCLGAPQPPRVDDLEQRGVPVSGQRSLPLRSHGAVHLLIGVIQESLQLLAGKRPRLRIALVVVEVSDRVPLVADRHRVRARPELPLTGHRPAIAAVAQVLAEQPQVRLVAADRGRGQALLAGQRLGPLINVRRPPLPRVLAGERQEPAHQPLPRHDRALPQAAGHVLGPPAAEHRLHHDVLRVELNHAGDQLKVRRARQVNPAHPALPARKPRPSDRKIMRLTGSN